MPKPSGASDGITPVEPDAVTDAAELVARSGNLPYLTYDAVLSPGSTGYALGDAVAFLVQPHFSQRPVRVSLVGGSDPDAQALLAWIATRRPWDDVAGISIERHREPWLHQWFTVGSGGDWDWLYATDSPPRTAVEDRIVTLDDAADAAELIRLNELGNPTAESEPGSGITERWAGIRDAGAIVSAAALHRSDTGHGLLAGIVTHPQHRGRGYGRAVTASLTRDLVTTDGVAVLGMYSDNDPARALYDSLGYRVAHRFSSRPVHAVRVPHTTAIG